MTQRVKLTTDVHMNLDGQPQIVLSGSVIDVPSTVNLSSAHIQVLTEQAGNVTLCSSVRGVRTR